MDEQQVGLRRIRHRDARVRNGAVVLVCNPADDVEFCRAAEDAALAWLPADPAALQELLRAGYPRVVVRARGLSNEPFDAWYVYRDGSWTAAGSRAEGVA